MALRLGNGKAQRHDIEERRVARLESRAEIAELLARYAFLIDDHEFDALG